MERPKLRPIEAFPIEIPGQKLICLRDPLRYGNDLLVSPAVVEIIRFFNGRNTIKDIQAKLMTATGQLIYADLIEKLARDLDDNLLLESERFREAYEKIRSEYAASKVRAAAHAGTCYPEDADSLEAQLEAFFNEGAGAPLLNGAAKRRTVAAVSPHMDLRCAGSCYSWAYKELSEGAPDCETIILLGTSHYGGGSLFIVAEKAFETPLGRLEPDLEFISELRGRYGKRLDIDETAHRLEHSIEFQILFLQTIYKGRKPPKIVPILVTSFQQLIESVDKPSDDEEFAAFTGALKRTAADWSGRTAFVIGADLAHIGRKFGDEFAAESRLPAIERADLEMLKYVEAGDADGFFQWIKAENDCRRVCGFPPILTFLSSVDSVEGRLLKYEQWSERATESAVTYASLAFYEK